MGVKRDYAKAIDWYQRASDLGRPRGPCSRWRCCACPGAAARSTARTRQAAGVLGQARRAEGAPYNLALLYSRWTDAARQDVKRAAELLRVSADAGNPEAQYALATFYKEGTGVPERHGKRPVRLLQAASLADNVDAEVEYAIGALFTAPARRRTRPPPVALLHNGRQTRQSDRNKTASPMCWVSG